ncbi:hypothetical protein F4677DRAFT_182281 [Hypoxylon crocopeplum]|nr:hypothetical protein F4677DRAFT_182281 [Hypoxylon crocopeplum]
MATIKRKIPRRWTEEEDALLYNEAQKRSDHAGNIKDWHKIAAVLPGRSNKDCRKRWVNRVCGNRKMGAWSEEEDNRLLEAMRIHGQRWTVIASKVGHRSPDQCAKRWQQKLDPKLQHGGWSTKEDELLLECVEKHGREWKKIQEKHYANRSRNDLKNRYTILMRRVNSAPDVSGSPDIDEDVLNMSEGEPSVGDMDIDQDANGSDEDDSSSPQYTGSGIDDYNLERQIGNNGVDMHFDIDAQDWLGDMVGFSTTFDDNCQPQAVVSSKKDHNPATSSTGDLSIAGLSTQESLSYCSTQDASSRQSTSMPAHFELSSDQFQLDFSGLEQFVTDTMYMPEGGVVASEARRSSKVTLSVEDCDKDTLDQLMGVARTIKGKVKMEIES